MTNPVMEFLTRNAFPELAAAVRAVSANLTATWQRAVREALPAAHDLTRDQLRDDIPEILKFVANALESDQPEETEKLSAVAPVHGTARYDQGFNLEEVLIEYGILRLILIREVSAYLKRSVEVNEFLALSAALDVTLRRGVVRFVEHLTNQVKAAGEAQSKYLSFLSHDLRGGLNGVFLMIEVLKRELVDEPRLAETVGDLDIMRRSLMDTVATMDRFLHAERFRKGKVQFRAANVSVGAFLAEIVAHFSYQTKDKGVHLAVEMPHDINITSDKDLLTLVFQNLVSNALKYSRTGTTVKIGCTCENHACTISVRDQGPGIAPDKLTEIFTPFARGETHGQPGVGLGLTIARHAAQYLGASLRAESELGKGATFFVQLPQEGPKPAAPKPVSTPPD